MKDTPKRRREMSAAKQARVITPASKAIEASQPPQNPDPSSADRSCSLPAAQPEGIREDEVLVVEDGPVKQEPEAKRERQISDLEFSDVPIPSLEHDDTQQPPQQPQQQASSSSTHDIYPSIHDFSYAHQDFSAVFGTPIATPTY